MRRCAAIAAPCSARQAGCSPQGRSAPGAERGGGADRRPHRLRLAGEKAAARGHVSPPRPAILRAARVARIARPASSAWKAGPGGAGPQVLVADAAVGTSTALGRLEGRDVFSRTTPRSAAALTDGKAAGRRERTRWSSRQARRRLPSGACWRDVTMTRATAPASPTSSSPRAGADRRGSGAAEQAPLDILGVPCAPVPVSLR